MFWLAPVPLQDWSLHYERSGFLETGRYEEAVNYCRRLAKASKHAKVIEYGVSPQGRKMVALLISSEGAFDPKRLLDSKRPLFFVQNGIHSGEIEGKDASLILARRMLITGEDRKLLDGGNYLIVPIYSVDAHERFGPYNRINQNGPREMGWRATAQNYNLNRDWMKADAPETRAQLKLIHRFRPDFLFDNHTTDGADYPYVLTVSVPSTSMLPPDVAAWQRRYYAKVAKATEADGFLTSPYFSLIDASDPAKGITETEYSPRYSHGYWSILNRPSVLVETHVLKPYRQRVDSTLSLMRRTMEYCIGDAANLKAMNAAADTSERAGTPWSVLESRRTNESRPFLFRAHPYTPYRSELTGGMIRKWDRSMIQELPSKIFDTFEPAVTVEAPAAYAIPPEWTEVIDRIELHGLQIQRLRKPMTASFATYRFENVTFPPAPFEGRFQPRLRSVPVNDLRTLPVGTVVVDLHQLGSKRLLHLLEPSSQDSLLRWGLFNTIFETKEYYDDYAMEPVARELLAKDPALAKRFADRKSSDSAFAGDPAAQLRWIYEQSPWADDHLNRYPVVRLTADQLRQAKQ